MPNSRPKGLRDFTASDTDIQVSAIAQALPVVPKEGGTHFTTGLGLLGNGRFGDCYWASAAREDVTLVKIAGRQRHFSETSTLDTYAKYLGLDSADDLTSRNDQGTDAREGAKFRTQTGILDVNGHGARIGAYAFENDAEKLPAILNALGAGTVCVELTGGCEDEFNAAEQEGRPFVWDVQSGDKVVGGHAITGHYWTPDGIGVTSWDREGIITWDYLAKHMQTTVVYFSAAILDSSGTTPAGFSATKLREIVKEVTAN